MRIADKGPVDINNISQLGRGESVAPTARERSDKPRVEQSGDAAHVSISAEARKLQKVAALAEQGDDLRAEKVRQIKEQIENGTYQVEAADVAKSMVRHEISRLLGNA